ncbi:uncharacterized protein K02A2.6-like [Uranotaenia lowii]|uniref:uncharacterized protein K02A2.6-like n=1 Tax=Uranotaenia lowii TaxID=190385 RepID=UPI00247B1E52|nr:uncharacterized protein K02A2.6-like [Uranotaenia lowii]
MSNRLVIPEFYHQRILKQLHRDHPGMERMKALARSHVYWPEIDDDISTFVMKCEMCAVHAKSPPKTPPQPWPATHSPWERIHIDFAGPFKGLNFLVVVDAHSRWPEICTIVRSFWDSINDCFRQWHPIHFETIRKLCGRNGIQHLRISPYHPQSNGQSERFVDSLKRSLLIINDWQNIHESLQTFLQVYRSTPSRVLNGSTPAELMIGRKIRSILNLLEVMTETSDSKSGTTTTYTNNWKWVPGKILEVIGKVNFNILLEEHHGRRKLIRSHVDQVNLRYPGDASTLERQSTPLNILVDMFGIQARSSQPSCTLNVPEPEEDDPQPPAGESMSMLAWKTKTILLFPSKMNQHLDVPRGHQAA